MEWTASGFRIFNFDDKTLEGGLSCAKRHIVISLTIFYDRGHLICSNTAVDF